MAEDDRGGWPQPTLKFEYGDNVRSTDPSRPWRGFIVGWYKTPQSVGYSVESAFEYNHVMTFDQHSLELWLHKNA
jgi:hypothetical protein